MTRAPLGDNTVHLCIDMQNLMFPGGPWFVPWAGAATANIQRILEVAAERTVFTRFIPPRVPEDMPGTWKAYYERWRNIALDVLPADGIEVVEPLRKYAPPAHVIDKTRYSAFFGSELQEFLQSRHISTLVISGAETDVCVLSTICQAIDLGYGIIVVRDAICSSSDRCHDALLTLYKERFTQQLEIATTGEVTSAWRS